MLCQETVCGCSKRGRVRQELARQVAVMSRFNVIGLSLILLVIIISSASTVAGVSACYSSNFAFGLFKLMPD